MVAAPALGQAVLATGVPNLDLILGGGIPRGDVLLVQGAAGTGKTTLSLQVAFRVASRGENVLYVSTLSEPPTRLLRHVRPLAFYDEALVGKGLFLLSSYPLAKEGLEELPEAMIGAVKEHRAALLVLDGLMTIRDLHRDDRGLRTFIYDLGATLATLDCTMVVTSSGLEDEQSSPELTMTDGILQLGMEDVGSQTVRTVQVRKLRGLAPLLGRHSLRIDQDGITVFPRLESVYEPVDVGLSAGHVSLGLPEMDTLIAGGPLAGSITILAGALGTGKTLAALHFLMAGAQLGQRGLLLGFRESPRQLIDKARAFGLDLESAVRDGLVAIMHRPPVDLVVDEVTWELREALGRLSPQRVVLDSIAELEQDLPEERRRRGYMASLVGLLRGGGATTLATKEIAQVIGPELDFSDTPLAVLAENLVLFRYVEFRGELLRVLSVLKMRDSDFDPAIRQYMIGQQGLRVLDRLETAEGVLTGIARLPGELRTKRPREAERRTLGR